MTTYIDFDKLEAITAKDFLARKPYPYADLHNLLTPEGYEALLQNMPDLELLEQKFGDQRRAGQQSHDRYSLEYTEDNPAVPEPWREFIDELRSDRYRNSVARLFNVQDPEFRFHWHYAPTGCSVSPHCDANREYGSHIFYFNSEQEWDPNWGGDTLVLDDGGRMTPDSAPTFEDFEQVIPCKSVGNASMLFNNNGHSWHGVRALNCPDDQLRKVFIIVINPSTLFWKVRDKLIGKSIQRL